MRGECVCLVHAAMEDALAPNMLIVGLLQPRTWLWLRAWGSSGHYISVFIFCLFKTSFQSLVILILPSHRQASKTEAAWVNVISSSSSLRLPVGTARWRLCTINGRYRQTLCSASEPSRLVVLRTRPAKDTSVTKHQYMTDFLLPGFTA